MTRSKHDHRQTVLAVVLVASILGSGGGVAQTAPPVLQVLHGTWTGTGELFSRPASFTMSWDVSDDGVAVLKFANAMLGEDGTTTPILTATAIYRAGADSVRGVWLDSRNERLELSAAASPNALITTWKSASEGGRTEYRVQPDGSVEVLDHVETADGWRHFGTARYERVEKAASSGPPTH